MGQAAVWLCALLLLLTGPAGLAAERWDHLAETVFDHYGRNDGLPNDTVTALAQDGAGFIWVGTYGGVARFDGYRFKLFKHDPDDPASLPDNEVRSLSVDGDGRLWVGTTSAGLARFDPALDQFVTYPAGPGGLSQATVTGVAGDGKGGFWVGTWGGLNHLDPVSGRIEQSLHAADDKTSLPDNRIRRMLVDRAGRLWLATPSGLFHRDSASGAYLPVALPHQDQGGVSVTALTEDAKGLIWFGTLQGAAGSVDPAHFTVSPVGGDLGMSSEAIRAIAEIRPGVLWFASSGGGIHRLDTATGEISQIRHDPLVPNSLMDDTLFAVLRDRSGLIWVGMQSGLSRHDPGHEGIRAIYGATSRPDGLSEGKVVSVMAAGDGRIWLGLATNGIDIIDPMAGRVGGFRPGVVTGIGALARRNVYAFNEAAGGDVWVGSYPWLYHADAAGAVLNQIPLPKDEAAHDLLAIAAADQALWLATGDGLRRYDPVTGDRAAYRRGGNDQPDSLSDNRIRVILPAPDGRLWVGTEDGLNRLDPRSGRVERVSGDPAAQDRLAAANVSSLAFDPHGRLWVGTFGGGLYLLEAQAPFRFRHLGTAQGLVNDNIDALICDRQGQIWASTDDGLARIDPDTFAVQNFGIAEGVRFRYHYPGAAAIDAQGELLFGGLGGLTMVQPDRLSAWRWRPPVVVTEARIGTRLVPAGRFNAGLPLTVTPEDRGLQIEFAALDFSAPERNRYQYRLDGFDADWIDSDASRRLAAYTSLPPGEYRLLLRGSNRDGVWSEAAAPLPIRVLPAWYQTIWWKLLLALAGLGVVVGVIGARTAWLRARQRELEREVAERTAELLQSQQELVESNHALLGANQALTLSAETLRRLSEIGREITASLDAGSVFQTLHHHIGSLLEARSLRIYRPNQSGDALEGEFGMAFGAALDLPPVALSDPDAIAALAARESREVVVDSEDPAGSALFAPLIADDKLLGVMGIEAPRAQAYGERERLIFRSLCAYGAIALANANALEALRAAQAQLILTEKMAALGQVIAGVAHEIQNPLNFVNNFAVVSDGLLTELADLPAESRDEAQELVGMVRQNLQSITRHGARAAAIVRSMLQHAQNRSGVVEPVNLNTLLQNTYAAVVVASPAREQAAGVELRWQLDPSLRRVDVVAQDIASVFANLIRNALYALDARRRAGALDWYPVLTLSSRSVPGGVEILVHDNGTGMAETVRNRLFTPFFTTKPAGEGTGLGLSLSFDLVVKRHRGRLEIISEEGSFTEALVGLSDRMAGD